MELSTLYDQIENPIDRPGTIEKLIEVFSKSNGGFYSKLTRAIGGKTGSTYYVSDADRFHSMLFNKWKKSILSLTREEYIQLYKQGSLDQSFIKLRNYLKKVPDVSTMKEADNIFYGEKGDEELEKALEKYAWTALGEFSGWTHVCSRYLTAKKDPYPLVEHRLYLNTVSTDTYKMVTYLYEKCEKSGIPFYFKFDIGSRDDTIVIYSSTTDLTKYIEILQEIKKEHPDLVSRAKAPTILTGYIDGWIGYGSEPEKLPNGKRTSFNEKRADIIEDVISKNTRKWVMSHKNDQITYRGVRVSFQNYITIKAVESIIETLRERYETNERHEINRAKNNGTTFDPMTLVNKYGYSLQDLDSSQFKQYLFRNLQKHIAESLDIVCNGNYKNIKSISIMLRNEKKTIFYGANLKDVINSLAIEISKHDPTFAPSIKEDIKRESSKKGIDSEKYCFDIHARDRIRQVAASRVTTKIRPKPEQKTINMSSLDPASFVKTINPALLSKIIKLPNGRIITAKDYIEKFVYPQLPKNGVIILNNGTVLTVKQFVEEDVLFECQDKFDGDLPRYLTERTRKNIGIITIKQNDKIISINPVEITKYINPAILQKRVILPNGAQISAEQYIQEFYAPHIPENGRVILRNGAEISVIQYIEEELLGESQTKYNGRIDRIVFNTTRSNNGLIDASPQNIQSVITEMRSRIEPIEEEKEDEQKL